MALAGAFCVPTWATQRSVTLSLPIIDCAVCPITVKKALVKVAGVSRAEVSFDKRQAVITFDDARTSGPALTRATQDAGCTSTVVGSPKERRIAGIHADLPAVRHARAETMPTYAWQWFYECEPCHTVLKSELLERHLAGQADRAA